MWDNGVRLQCAQSALFIIDHGGVHWLPDYPIHGWILVTSQHHIESDNMKVKPSLFDPLPQRDHDYDI